ncbi:BREX-1 system adenine-specific DNA-methyltransferase PglX [Pseudomonas salomonii]|uniref:site-specific DNA-methyltransferase (adenine-specific) n=1 Tax=Pseudomonas salomonii TaxID=191391 RepID=A0A7Y8KMV2_9PSED|nr:BREX-1 system adenine-specific DNA-methyltransferase PglX [Pseudomonas salomonii]NWF08288.1 BREX-1 system adenine-specific DNA-methyltransferase PglX [Pseudomonas salomonii]
MNRSALKKYAPQARLDFIETVTLRARRLGLDPTLAVNVEQNGDVLLIGGQPFPATIGKQRAMLARRIQQQGFSAVVEALAYTWFNRLVAIRFMELKGYLSHGYRVLSHPQGQQPEILDHVQHLELTGLDKVEVIRLKTAGNQDEALYREILLAQCHELHRNMPFLFEALDDATELLLPDNLLRTDSPIARLVNGIEEDDWKEVEVIGWLYQFYISDKKDEVIGKVVKSEDIPAATQLFTPNWIVQYLVQNSLGRLWLMANPGSRLKEKMPYYIEPAEQTPEVQARLDALIKVRVEEDGGTLNPEFLSVLDPACGSGHILVEAYNLLRAIYEERGYRSRDIPRLILQKNLFGLDIDDRAAQLAGFALLMKAREDDRRLFDDEGNPPGLNVMAVQQSSGLLDEEIAQSIISAAIQIEGGEAFQSGQLFGGGQLETHHSSGLTVLDLRQLIRLFEHGKTFGSLISVPAALKLKLGKIVDLLVRVSNHGDDLSRSYAAQVLEQFAWPASLLALQYDAVVANPPYMGGKGMNFILKEFAKDNFPYSKFDLFAMFIERGFQWCKPIGFNSMVTMHTWMFLSSYELMRQSLLADRAIHTMAHLGAKAFGEISGEVVQTTAFVLQGQHLAGFKPVFFRLVDGVEEEKRQLLISGGSRHDSIVQDDFRKIPGSPVAYWAGESIVKSFQGSKVLDYSISDGQNKTADNDKYLRCWWEVEFDNIGVARKWLTYCKGGEFSKWYGNLEYVVDWSEGARQHYRESDRCRIVPEYLWYKKGITWSRVSSKDTPCSFRLLPLNSTFDMAGSSIFIEDDMNRNAILSLLNSKLASVFIPILNPSIDLQVRDVRNIPYDIDRLPVSVLAANGELLIELSKEAWDERECSLEFGGLEYGSNGRFTLLHDQWAAREAKMNQGFENVKRIECENNRLIINSYDMQAETLPEILDEHISFPRADRKFDMQRLVSFIIGCMMGRYSLDEPGLIYAHSRSMDFDHSRYGKFPADVDGIIPITDEPWFVDDAAERVREFVKVVWGGNTLVDNMEWLADSLSRKSGESADEVVRRYLSTIYYKDHLQTYKKRPIYWLFSSGKQKAFECLVYLHRYNEGTLSRMRMEYVVPLQSRMQARIDKLADDINSATGSAQQKALQKRKDKFTKQLEELRRFDETLRPYADQRIALNLDDGVKVNYGKFGDLLAEVKVITGGKDD